MNEIFKFLFLFVYFLNNCQCADMLDNHLDTIVKIPGVGSIIGSKTFSSWTNQTILQFMGIPYAESPSNDLRFKAPVPKLKWNGIHNGTKFGRPCPNINYLNTLTDEEKLEDLEDCLNLYVYTKNLNNNSPVMVYIHGGALAAGAATEHMPHYLLENDVVLVAIQYRLGALGFISTRSKDVPGNMGVLDTILALKWIKKNIEHFGGDPKEITVFGQSAGACVLSLLTVTPKINENLFKRAIIQSGSYLISQLYKRNPIQDAQKICMEFNCENCEAINNVNDCLKSASLKQLVNANNETKVPFGFTSLDYEGVVPVELEELGKSRKNINEIMIGATKQDGAFVFTGLNLNVTLRKYLDTLIKQLGEDNYSGVIRNLFSSFLFTADQLNQNKINLKEMIPSISDIATLVGFKSPIQQYIELYLNNIQNKGKIYLYAFDYVGEQNYMHSIKQLKKFMPHFPIINGVHHADDLLYLFPPTSTRGHSLNPDDTKLAKTMTELWTSYAITGIPKTKNMNLPSIETPRGPYFHINKQITIGTDFTDEFFVSKNEMDNIFKSTKL